MYIYVLYIICNINVLCTFFYVIKLKLYFQTNPEKYAKGVLSAAKDIVATEGASFLLSGLGIKEIFRVKE
jgi:hypothetical protein